MFEIAKLRWIEGAREAIKIVNDAGYFAFAVTNQSGVARGLYEEAHVNALHDWMSAELAKAGAHIDAFEYCPYHPDGTVEKYRSTSDRRKPGAGMITDLERFPVDVSRSILVSDRRPALRESEATCLREAISQSS